MNNSLLIFVDCSFSSTVIILKFSRADASVSSIHNNSVCLFKNIHIDKESDQVWEQIKKHEKVTVTIDTFKWGLVFFRKEQEKEHFIIRI